ncbi:CopD family protein [Mycolicibacterium duvalii]|uniref:Copper resistance protein D n=1 Tax=Mycolicibacterium duvalii TaxID=39688 RepID=A0A7I7K7W1_9MYCO|nr:CopD family protein [Mycolicibacterium duvalii]BBX19684.1 copper resistance protein D [Mycolicibacterium duvalii]
MTRPRAVAGAALVAVVTCLTAWALAYPAAPLGATVVRAVALGAAVTTLGLAVVPALDTGRYRAELRRRAAAPLVVAAAVWLVAELARVLTSTASAAGTPVLTVGWHTAADFLATTSAGRAALLTIAAAALVVALAVLAPVPGPAGAVVAGAAAVGLVGHSVSGHLAGDPVGSVAVAGHTLAAALWCGALAALSLTVEHRGQWSRVLPRFSQLSLWCVIALLAAGVTAAAIQLPSAGALFSTGYGRVLTLKVVCTAVLLTLAWRHRSVWVPAARGHRSTAALSRRRAVLELAVMAVALAAAATLAVTG